MQQHGLKLAVVVGLLAAIAALIVMTGADPQSETAPPQQTMTIDNFIFTAKTGTPEELAAALATGVKPDEKDRMGRTALTEALLVGMNDNARALLEAGASPTLAGRDGYTPLILASNTGDPELIELLIDKGADPNRGNAKRVTALHTACRSTAENNDLVAIVSKLLHAGADPNAKDDDGFTPLMVAASRGRVDPMILLLDAGAKINERNKLGFNAITYAVMSGDFAYRAGWEMDLENMPPDAVQRLGFLALAVGQSDSLASVRLLLARGADINIQDTGGWTPIMRAAALGDIDRYKRLILDAGGDAESPQVQSKLQDLVKQAHGDQIVMAMRNADAYVNLPNNEGADALTISRMRTDQVGKLIHGLLLEGKRISISDLKPSPQASDGG